MSFELPKLPYAYDALEPHIDARTMEIHHSKHHQGYTNNLNNSIEGTQMEGKNQRHAIKMEWKMDFGLNGLKMERQHGEDVLKMGIKYK